jgi:hypothetical protein
MRQNTKPLEEARRQQKRFQGAAVQIAAIMRFVDERIAEGITDEHDLANQPLDWYGKACEDWATTRVVQHASGQQLLPHFTQLADYLVRAIAAAMLMRHRHPQDR